MTYDQAYNIGTRIEGYIKCTYVQLFDYDEGKVFSLNKRSDVNSSARRVMGIGYEPKNVDYKIAFSKDRPIVIAAGKASDDIVPVHLTDYAVEIIHMGIKAIMAVQPYLKTNAGHAKLMEYNHLLTAINASDTYYVKKVAVDWFPTDGANMTIIDPTSGQPILLADAIKEAENKMDQAKKILLMAAGASIIL